MPEETGGAGTGGAGARTLQQRTRVLGAPASLFAFPPLPARPRLTWPVVAIEENALFRAHRLQVARNSGARQAGVGQTEPSRRETTSVNNTNRREAQFPSGACLRRMPTSNSRGVVATGDQRRVAVPDDHTFAMVLT